MIEAANGRFALEHLRKDEGTITLVLSDLVMPELSGQQLFERACHLPRTIPFLFMSGYSEEGVPSSGASEPALLTKPFTPEQLLQAVRAALSGHAAIARGDTDAGVESDNACAVALPTAASNTDATLPFRLTRNHRGHTHRADRVSERWSVRWRLFLSEAALARPRWHLVACRS